MIPKILHYVWVGGPMPPIYREYIATWQETNPDFEIICWNERNIDMSSRIIQSAYAKRKWAKVADIARLQAVSQMGGIYLDTDFKLYRSIAPMLAHRCFFVFQENKNSDDWVCNGVFGAEPGHWFVKQALQELHALRPTILPERPTSYGPKHITRLLRQAGLGHTYSPDGLFVEDIFVVPMPLFFPFSQTETFTTECITEQTIGAHFWAKSWEGSIPKPVRMAKELYRHLRAVGRGR